MNASAATPGTLSLSGLIQTLKHLADTVACFAREFGITNDSQFDERLAAVGFVKAVLVDADCTT